MFSISQKCVDVVSIPIERKKVIQLHREPTRYFWSFWILNIFHIYQLACRVLIVLCFTVHRADKPMNWRSKYKIIAESSSNQLQASSIAVKSPILAFIGLRPRVRPLTFLKMCQEWTLWNEPSRARWAARFSTASLWLVLLNWIKFEFNWNFKVSSHKLIETRAARSWMSRF